MKIHEEVPKQVIPKRIDAFLAERLGGRYSRSQIKACLDRGQVLLNGRSAKPSVLVKERDIIEGELEADRAGLLPEGEAIPLRVIYEDERILVIDKPAGMVVHPGAGNKKGTLVHALLGRGGALSSAGGLTRPGIVHRLDKGTSGLLVVAKDDAAHRHLASQFASRTLSKTYLALVSGKIEFEEGHVEEPVGRHARQRQRMAVSREGGRSALTRYRVLERFRGATLLEVKPLTGRTHQIRVHLAHLGHPVVGDALYGRKKEQGRLALHAARLEFDHPGSGERVAFESPLPDDFKEMLKTMRNEKA